MPIADYNVSASLNTLISGIYIGPDAPRANIDDAIRQIMADLAIGIPPRNVAAPRSRGVMPFVIDRLRAFAFAEYLSNPANGQVFGHAALAPGGTTGGFGFPTIVYITNGSDDPDVPGSIAYALAQIKTAGGGYAICHPRGEIVATLDNVQYLPSNLTIVAPGRNFRCRTSLANGAFRFYGPSSAPGYGQNIIMWGIDTLVEGGSEELNYEVKPGEVDAFTIIPDLSNRIFMQSCTISGATDGAFDIAGGATPSGQRYYTLDRLALRNCDKVSAIGVGVDTLTEPTLVNVTWTRSSFLGCSQRMVMASSRSNVHFAYNAIAAVPHYRDVTDGTSIGEFGGGTVRYGGRLRYENNILRYGTTSTGRGGETMPVVAQFADPAFAGAALLSGNVYPSDATSTVSLNVASVAALPIGYTIPTIDMADSDLAWSQIVENAGAGRTNWPRGDYVEITAATADALGISPYANEEQVVYDGDIFYVRANETDPLDDIGAGEDPLAKVRGGTLTIAAGAITLTDDRVFAVAGEGALADDLVTINVATDVDIAQIKTGFIWLRTSSSALPITLKAGGNINVTRPVYLDDATKWVCLFWNNTAWDVVSVPNTFNTHTPALTADINCSALSVTRTRWQMSHNRVQVDFVIAGTATAAGTVRFDSTLPKAAPLLAAGELMGTFGGANTSGGSVYRQATSARFEFQATGAGAFSAIGSYSYEVN